MMKRKVFSRHILHFYAKVGAPELVFFICLLALFFTPYILEIEDRIISPIIYSLFVFSVEYLVFSWDSKYKNLLSSFLVFSIITVWFHHFDLLFSEKFTSLTQVLVFITSFYYIFKSIFSTSTFDFNTLLAAISGYLLIGMAFGMVVNIFSNYYPEYFSFTREFTIFDSYYYSFVTMSTLGYGDISPTSRGGQGLAILITLVGQFYMVVVMGMIIGKLLAPNNSDK